jgi:hypothetical protein
MAASELPRKILAEGAGIFPQALFMHAITLGFGSITFAP